MQRNQVPIPQISIPNYCQTQYLSDKDFESLKKVIQLLRVSQIRYIIQKFSMPFNGNKTKLVNLLLSLFQSLRYEKILIDIYTEINNLLSNKKTILLNHLELISQIDPSFYSQPNPMQYQSPPPYILGPISVPPGKSNGQFEFKYNISDENYDKLINISFLFPDGVTQQFELKGDCNGFPIEVSIDDPYPQPIDITDFINSQSDLNSLNIKMIQSTSPMMICIREYKYYGLQDLMNKIVGRPTNIDEDFEVFSSECQHGGSFSLTNFLSKSFATGDWSCPICGQDIDPLKLNIISADSKL